MKDVQIGVRIPQGTADNLLKVIEHKRSVLRDRGDNVTVSSVVRDAIDVYADMVLNRKIGVSIESMADKNENYKELLGEFSRLAHKYQHEVNNTEISKFIDDLVKQLLLVYMAI